MRTERGIESEHVAARPNRENRTVVGIGKRLFVLFVRLSLCLCYVLFVRLPLPCVGTMSQHIKGAMLTTHHATTGALF